MINLVAATPGATVFSNMVANLTGDIMHEYKNKKFVVTDVMPGVVVVLSNISYWTEHYDELSQWCEQHNAIVKGMTVELPDQETLTLFHLKWL